MNTRYPCLVCAVLVALASVGPALAAPDTGISDSARREIAAILAEKDSWTPAQQKLESALIHAIKKSRGEAYAPGAPNLQLDFQPAPDGRALADIIATVSPALLAEIQKNGGQVLSSVPKFNAIRALVPLGSLEGLAGRPEVASIRRAAKAHVNTADPEGNAVMLATAARSMYGVTGAGVKVGVLSDSVDYLTNAQASGDLGPVTVLSGQSGVPATGEGTAMLEIVHAIAPGAQLYFATANNGEASFANNILSLRSSGCNIIVDDIGYFDESPFQDATIAMAVNTVTAGGALYFSAAGNSGNLDSATSGTWEGDFVDGGMVTSPGSGHIHKFGNLTYDTIGSGGSSLGLDLFWSDPLGASTNNYDLFLLNSNGTTVVASSTNPQNGTQNPYQSIGTSAGVYPIAGQRIVIVRHLGTGRFLHLDTQRGTLDIATPGATCGHQAATNAFGVAAVDAALAYPNPFTGGPANPVETFSSDGPRHVFFNQDGSAMTPGNFSSTGGAVRQKPDVAAPDDVSTSVPGFASFSGTSAAAPHAAALAALLLSYNPALTPAQIRACLTSSALDIMAPGVDRNSGYGIVMATTALASGPPDALLITPASSVAADSPYGGPFAALPSFVLTNNGSSSFSWSLVNTSVWLNVSATNGSLSPGGAPTSISLAANATANSLAPGTYDLTLWFTNLNDSVGQSRQVLLTMNPLVHGAYANNVLSLAPVGYWRLNETNSVPPAIIATNSGSLGSAANGLGVNGLIQGQPGIVNTCFRFSNPSLGVTYFGSHADVPYQAALNPSGAFSVELWANAAQATTDLFSPLAAVDLTQNGGSSRLGWLFYYSPTNWQFRVGGLSGYAAILFGGSISTNVWHHLVGVYNGSSASLYVDGALVSGPTSASGFGPNGSQPLRFGATTIPNRTFDGWVDEVAFYNTALSAGTIAAHFKAATTNNAGYGAQILASSPLGYWHLDGPPYTLPAQSALPLAINTGSLAPNANGVYEPGCQTAVPGVPDPGLGLNNLACQFNGTSYIDVSGLFLDFTGPVSVLAWVKANTANGSVQSVVSRGAASYRLMLDATGHPRFACGAQPSGDLAGPNRVDDQNWHQWMGVYDGVQSESLYVDAHLVASNSNATNLPVQTPGDLWIGGDPDPGAYQPFNGLIDEVALFSNVVSPAQVQQMYFFATNSPAAPSFTVATTITNKSFRLSWSAAAGQSYQLQYKTNFLQLNWANLGTPTQATSTNLTALDIAPADKQRFYRIVLLE